MNDLTQDGLYEIYNGLNSSYQVWTYGEGNELRMIFDPIVLGGSRITPYAVLAPNPAAMIEAIQSDPSAIGYIPQSWLPVDMNIIQIERELQNGLSYPILALTQGEPDDQAALLIECLQQSAE
jgi:hypothetical protein